MTNARFWILWHVSPVKITLGPGEETSFGAGRSTDEGWSFEGIALHYDADRGVVTMSEHTDGVDCDGRLQTSAEYECPFGALHDRIDPEDDSVRYPAWQRVSASQRDYTAEAMGY